MLKGYEYYNKFRSYFRKVPEQYDDFAIWVNDYIAEFEKHSEHEYHIISPHKGMKLTTQTFNKNGINYYFYKCDGNPLFNVISKRLRFKERNDYSSERRQVQDFISQINPDIIILCGAENPYYSLSILDVKDKPIYVILQTLLNDSKRIEMGLGTQYRRRVECLIFKHAGYFCTSDKKSICKIQELNSRAVILPAGFPTHQPNVSLPIEKKYDFVFFSRNLSKYKGVEDLFKALAIVKKRYVNINLNVIGNYSKDYKDQLNTLNKQLGISENVKFSGYFNDINDTYESVVEAKCVVVPGITASLNSTVRESMLMGLPTICYETKATKEINAEKKCLLVAKMEDVEDLAKQMLFSIEHVDETQKIAISGRQYAHKVFSNQAIVNRLLENCNQIINGEH